MEKETGRRGKLLSDRGNHTHGERQRESDRHTDRRTDSGIHRGIQTDRHKQMAEIMQMPSASCIPLLHLYTCDTLPSFLPSCLTLPLTVTNALPTPGRSRLPALGGTALLGCHQSGIAIKFLWGDKWIDRHTHRRTDTSDRQACKQRDS